MITVLIILEIVALVFAICAFVKPLNDSLFESKEHEIWKIILKNIDTFDTHYCMDGSIYFFSKKLPNWRLVLWLNTETASVHSGSVCLACDNDYLNKKVYKLLMQNVENCSK